MTIKDAAARYIAHGYSPIPLSGKRPIVPGWTKFAEKQIDDLIGEIYKYVDLINGLSSNKKYCEQQIAHKKLIDSPIYKNIISNRDIFEKYIANLNTNNLKVQQKLQKKKGEEKIAQIKRVGRVRDSF